MGMLLCPSMMCANYDCLANEVHELDLAGADIFHCDVMDGVFVPNMTMGLTDIQCIRRNTNKLVDVHLMIENPGEKIQRFLECGCDLIYIHPESERYCIKTLGRIKESGKLAGLAINPDTSLETVREILHLVDYVMVMTVTPGFAGQKYIEFVTEKIKRLVSWKEQFHFKLTIDGACSPERIRELSRIGADGFVLGTSALFGKEKTYRQLMDELRALA